MFHTTLSPKYLLTILLLPVLFVISCNEEKKPVEKAKPEVQPQPTDTLKKVADENIFWDFENVEPGKIPEGWKVEGTNQRGPLATWKVMKDPSAPSGEKVLAMAQPNHTSGSTFNLCWTPKVSFLNGEIEVLFKANTGNEDQGGGVIWRAKDKDNYYIARFNPLEDNFRIYTVHNGNRRTLVSAKIALPAGKWHTLKIVQQDNHFEGYLNGKKLLDGENDLFPNAGGIGLWTKADAVTSFDNLTVRTDKK